MKKLILLFVFTLLLLIESSAQQFVQQSKIPFAASADISTNGRWIGRNLSLKNNQLTAGSSGELLRPWSSGDPIYTPSRIFDVSMNTSYSAQRLADISFNDPSNYNTNFGISSATNGTVAVFGEPRYFEGGSTAEAMGSATVFEFNGAIWQPKQRLLASDKSNNSSFGTTVAVNEDQIFVGTKVWDQYALRPGAVYIFGKDNADNWVEVQKLSPPANESVYVNYFFGHNVVVSGNYLLVSTSSNAQVNSGGTLAYLYKKNINGIWELHQTVTSPPGIVFVTQTMAISGNYLALGGTAESSANAEAVLVFEKDAGDVWSFKQRIDDPDLVRVTQFGGTAISLSGDILAVGAPSNSFDENEANLLSGTGAIYIYQRNASANWVKIQKVVAKDRLSSNFGYSVALDGSTLVAASALNFKSDKGVYQASTYYEGEIYIFKNSGLGSLPLQAVASFAPGRVANVLYATPDLEPILTIGLTGAQPLTSNLTTAKVWKQNDEQLRSGKLYLTRNYEITPTNNINTSTATVTLYFNQQEFLDFNANPAKTADFPVNAADLNGIANLRILKISGSSSDNSGLINTYAGTPLVINPDDDKIIWNATANRWEVTFSVTGFSGFFATTEPTVLPVTLVDFTVSKENNYAKLQWKTSSETNNKNFIIYRSGDDQQFVQIGEVFSAHNPSVTRNYSFIDKQPLNGNNYYKLVQIDYDGKQAELGERALSFSLSALGLQVYPNPATEKVTLLFTPKQFKHAQLIDQNGKVLKTVMLKLTDTQAVFDLSALPVGIYLVRLQGEGQATHEKIVKK